MASITLLWLSVGAGGHVARRTSAWWEHASAALARRPAQALVHAALEVTLTTRVVVEMAPAWNVPADERGVVVTGPVALAVLGRSRFFRYEVRRWSGGEIPDRAWALATIHLEVEPGTAQALLQRVAEVPPLTWGRAPAGTRDMWNSNSLISWLLTGCDLAKEITPPPGTRAPGWEAGIAVARAEASGGAGTNAPTDTPGG